MGQRYKTLTMFYSQKYGNETSLFPLIFASAIIGPVNMFLIQIYDLLIENGCTCKKKTIPLRA